MKIAVGGDDPDGRLVEDVDRHPPHREVLGVEVVVARPLAVEETPRQGQLIRIAPLRVLAVAAGLLLALGLYGILFTIWDRPAGWPQGWLGWLLLALLLALFGKDHPAPYDPSVRLDPGRRRLGYLCLAIFVLCFTPVPFRF